MKSAPVCTTSRSPTAISIPTYQPFLVWIQRNLNSLIILQIEKSLWNKTSLGTSVTRPSRTACWIQQRRAPWCLFDSSTREVGSIRCRSRAFTIRSNWRRTRKRGSSIWFLWRIWDPRFLVMQQCCVRVRIGGKLKARIWWCNLMAYDLRVWPDGKQDTTWWHTARWYDLIDGLGR